MNRFLKKSVSTALICATLLTTATSALTFSSSAANSSSSVSASANASKTYKITKKKVPIYVMNAENKSEIELYFINGGDIPYLEIDDCASFMQMWYIATGSEGFNLTKEAKDNKVTLTRESGYNCVIDFDKDTFYFQDYDEFIKRRADASIVDLLSTATKDENGKPTYFKRSAAGSNNRYGSDITMDLASYNIDLVHKGSKYYIPLATFNDVFFWNGLGSFTYNGKAVFLVQIEGTFIDSNFKKTELGKIYYKGTKKKSISKELTEYNYNELCLALDNLYGLKDTHKITSFDKLMHETGLKETMLSGNPVYIDSAIYTLATRYLDDIHTKYGIPSAATGSAFRKEIIEGYGEGPSRDATFALGDEYKAARDKYFPNGVPGYEEVGDTAFITFDEFIAFTADTDYYKTAPTKDAKDTIGLVAYSVQQILRKDSPVKNVVLDLSCNGGGAADTAVYTIAAFLGKAKISLEDTFTGALATSEFLIDTNFDHKFDEKDTLANKGLNLYCLESGVSFSCGNLVPCALKESSSVSLIGETSGGGACSVIYIPTATGGAIRISSPTRISFMKNGSFYDVDRGADPDFSLSKKDSYYDREALVEYIHSLK